MPSVQPPPSSMTTTLWACVTTIFPFPGLPLASTSTAKCYFRQSPAGLVSKGNKTGSSEEHAGTESEAKRPSRSHICASPLLLALSSLPRLFFFKRKAETCRVCFSPLGCVPAFKAQVLANRESSFRKTRGGSEWMREGWSDWILFVSLCVQTGGAVCQLPVKQTKTHCSVLTSPPLMTGRQEHFSTSAVH